MTERLFAFSKSQIFNLLNIRKEAINHFLRYTRPTNCRLLMLQITRTTSIILSNSTFFKRILRINKIMIKNH